MDYLPYHYLLVTGSDLDTLHYRDVSTGMLVAKHRTKKGPTTCITQNKSNGVILTGHQKGIVQMWTPNVAQPVVSMLAHRGAMTAMACDGNYIATGGNDGRWKVWDIRNYKCVTEKWSKGTSPTSIDISMTGLLAVSSGCRVEVYKNAMTEGTRDLYMHQMYPSQLVSKVQFRPYEDVLCVGHSAGFGSLVVPGAGFANYDAFEANPFESRKQARESEIRKVLEKLQPDTIMLNPNLIGQVDSQLEAALLEEQEKANVAEKIKLKNKARGKSKAGKKQMRMQKIKDTKRRERFIKAEEIEEIKKKKEVRKDKEKKKKLDKKAKKIATEAAAVVDAPVVEESVPSALARFEKKKKKKNL